MNLLVISENERLALAACAIIVATTADNLRNLTADERTIALRGRRNAQNMLLATNINPTSLKELGLKLCHTP